MKGISAIIATILLLLITISLATVAYVYVNNLVGSKTSKSFQLLSPSCGNGKISFVLSSTGTKTITNTDITIIVDNKLNTTNFEENGVAGDTVYSVTQNQAIVLVNNNTVPSGSSYQLRISTPSDSQTFSVFC